MAWTSPPTVVTGDSWSAGDQNTYIRDNEDWLKAWLDAGYVPSGTALPSQTDIGLFYRTDEDRLYAFNGTGWDEIPRGAARTLALIANGEVPGGLGLGGNIDMHSYAIHNILTTDIATTIPTGYTSTIAAGQFTQVLLPVDHYSAGIQVDGTLQVDGGFLLMGV